MWSMTKLSSGALPAVSYKSKLVLNASTKVAPCTKRELLAGTYIQTNETSVGVQIHESSSRANQN